MSASQNEAPDFTHSSFLCPFSELLVNLISLIKVKKTMWRRCVNAGLRWCDTPCVCFLIVFNVFPLVSLCVLLLSLTEDQ